MKKILPAITTTYGSNWKENISQIDKLNLEEIALFPTCLNKEERQEMYELLSKTKLKRIPFVHLRNDFDEEEIGWLKDKYQTKIFNTHSEKKFPLKYSWNNYKKECIYLENTHSGFSEEEIIEYAGICIDFTHMENARLLHPKRYEQIVQIIKKNKIGCAHFSAIKEEQHPDPAHPEEVCYDWHLLEKLSEMDYLKIYPEDFFPDYIAIELENSLAEQLEIKKYLENFITL